MAGVQALHEGGSPWRLDIQHGAEIVTAVLRVADWGRIWGVAIAQAAAGLEVAGEHDLPTARLIASDAEGHETGECALLETYCTGNGRPSGPESVYSAGAALAKVHAIRMEPTPRLPLRLHHNPYDDYPAERRSARRSRDATHRQSEALLHQAEKLLSDMSPPTGESVFLHGDPWFGNMLWDDHECVGLIDWKACGVGHPGVDLGDLRMQATFSYGPDAADAVTAGWQDTIGRDADAVAYWDAIAALNTPADYGATRDAFLDAALRRLT